MFTVKGEFNQQHHRYCATENFRCMREHPNQYSEKVNVRNVKNKQDGRLSTMQQRFDDILIKSCQISGLVDGED